MYLCSTVISTNFQHSFRKWTLAVEEGVCGSEIYAKVEMSPLINRHQPSTPRINLKHIFTLFTDTYAIVIGIQRKQGANWNVDIWIVG